MIQRQVTYMSQCNYDVSLTDVMMTNVMLLLLQLLLMMIMMMMITSLVTLMSLESRRHCKTVVYRTSRMTHTLPRTYRIHTHAYQFRLVFPLTSRSRYRPVVYNSKRKESSFPKSLLTTINMSAYVCILESIF